MAAILFHEPVFSTQVASGDKLYFYEVGTTTDLTVYTDFALTTEATQPVVADSSGQFVPLYIDATGNDPKVVLKSASDVEKWTCERYPIEDLTTLTATVATNTSDITTLEGSLAIAEAEIDVLQTESADYESRLASLEGVTSPTSSANETVLYDNTSAPTSGALTLSQSYLTFDAVVFVTTYSGSIGTRTPNFFPAGLLDDGGTFGAVCARGATSNAKINFTMTDTTTVTVSGSEEATRIVKIIGIKYATIA